jgi:hypothetical protein
MADGGTTDVRVVPKLIKVKFKRKVFQNRRLTFAEAELQ